MLVIGQKVAQRLEEIVIATLLIYSLLKFGQLILKSAPRPCSRVINYLWLRLLGLMLWLRHLAQLVDQCFGHQGQLVMGR